MEVPTNESGYDLGDWFPTSIFDYDAMMIQTSPFPYDPCGAVLLFKSTNPKQAQFVVTIFTTGLSEDSDSISQDMVRVYNTTKSAEEFYFEDFADWFKGQRQRELPEIATSISRDGLEAWTLDGETFVRVVVERNTSIVEGSIATANIFAGSSWQRDILGPGANEDSS